jgi:anaerobic magnesium-protoporphyrin IX monomethyl ester cyclase
LRSADPQNAGTEANMSGAKQGVEVMLVGRERPGLENLGLRYVAAELERAGHRPRMLALCGPGQISVVAREIIARSPPLVGLAISDSSAALDHLVLARLLRKLGYSGHITAGGALATLVRHELLERQHALDSIVRHEGELPMAQLADRIGDGRPWQDVAGLTTRGGDGAPAPIVCAPWRELWPVRPEKLYRVLGVPSATLVGSRGCLGQCGYCSSVVLRREALAEGRRAGYSAAVLERTSVGGRMRRTPGDLAEEVSALYHDSGARIFQLLDDNLVGGDAGASEAWLHALLVELRRRGVRSTAWSLMIDPESVSESLLDLFEELGVVRVLVGIESLTEAGLAVLGRPGSARTNQRALERLTRRGVATVFNSIAVHPAATEESVRAELCALEAVPAAYFELNSLAAYARTELAERLCRTGRATGGLFGYRYQPSDPTVTRFMAALSRFALEGRPGYDAGLRAHELAANLAIARRLELGAYDRALDARAAELVKQSNAYRLAAWRTALQLSAEELTLAERTSAVTSLLHRLHHELLAVERGVAEIDQAMRRRAGVHVEQSGSFATRGATAGLVVFMAAAACGGVVHREEAAAGTSAVSSSGGAAASGGASSVGSGGVIGTGGVPPAGTGGAEEAGARWGSLPGPTAIACGDIPGYPPGFSWEGDDGAPASCTSAGVCDDVEAVAQAIQRNGPCFEPCIGSSQWGLAVDASGKVVDVMVRPFSRDPDLETVRECALEVLGGETFPCLSGGEVWQLCEVLLL